ncbi:Folylpolyglutamate synthase [Bacillus sp. THAF10]|uniref:bifunctional folylpolyglutamate synthase/dihydrofolate synthase n=1 Tax=Bacillus sp. THAF10 TaxID=2587848 RepID=UPI0012A87CE0|nr:Mur ligase family protein [Bacillus sp. THAF10]QFT90075.1 Folylpolyglutamate synthase [Bacillus sp. THAF10]
MTFHTMKDAIPFLYSSLLKAKPYQREENDAHTRAPHLTRMLLEELSLLPSAEKTILVTGSKGKGSTSRMIAAILQGMGWRVGLFTSPHLVDFNERIRVNGKSISDERFLAHLNRHAPHINEIAKTIKNPQHYLGPTGILLSLALAHFEETETDINVIEIGRGGLYDDTNVLDNKWAVISKVMLEHLGFLGHTMTDIAFHKSGIVKNMTEHTIVGKQSEDASFALKKQLGERPSYYGYHFWPTLRNAELGCTHFDLVTPLKNYRNLPLSLMGTFQVENASLAIRTCETIIGSGLDERLLKETFSRLRWPGRLEVISKDPFIILDGSINRESAVYLKEVLPLVNTTKVATIIGVPENKDYEGVIEVCSTFSDLLVVTTPDNSHKSFPADALEVARRYHPGAIEVDLLSNAVKMAMAEKATCIFVVGTQSMIGSAKEIWRDRLEDLE